MTTTRTRTLTECALLLALSTALSYIKLFTLPFDGSITPFSMLPLCLLSVRHGLKWGLPTAFLYAIIQILQGGVFAWGLTPTLLVGCLLLDYFLAFTALGLAGAFRRFGTAGALLGIALACLLRFLCHLVSGAVLFATLEEFVAFGKAWVGRPWLYSLCYNGIYMLPETAMTVLGAFLLFRLPQAKKLFLPLS